MTGRTFTYQSSFDEFVRTLLPDVQMSERRKSVGIGDSMLRELEEFVNRFAVTATNDDGDITFDAAGTYTFNGDLSIAGDVSLSGDLTTLGGAIQTSASGQRAVLDPSVYTGSGSVNIVGVAFYTGDVDEDVPGFIGVGGSGSSLVTEIRSPEQDSKSANIRMTSTPAGAGADTFLWAEAENISLFGYDPDESSIMNFGTGAYFSFNQGADSGSASGIARIATDGIHAQGARYYFGIASDNYIQMSDSYFRVVQDANEDFRVDDTGRVFAGGGRYCFNIAGDAFLDWDDGSGDFEFQDNNVGVLRFARTGSGFTSYSGGSTRSWSFESAIDGPAEWYFPTRNAAGDAIEVYVTGFGLDPNTVAVMRADGDWENDNGRYGTLSDARTKRYIRPLQGHRDVLLNHPPKSFQKYMQADADGNLFWRKEPINTYGYVAQEAHPSLVFQSGGDLLGVAEGRNVPWLHAGWIEHDERLARVESLLGLVS
jgi:hypothetical protein